MDGTTEKIWKRRKGRGELSQQAIFREELLHAIPCVKDFSCIPSLTLHETPCSFYYLHFLDDKDEMYR